MNPLMVTTAIIAHMYKMLKIPLACLTKNCCIELVFVISILTICFELYVYNKV